MNVPMNSVDQLKQRLVEVWNSLQQNVTDAAINIQQVEKAIESVRACR